MRGSKFFLKELKLSESQIEISILHYLVHSLRLFAWKAISSGFYDSKIKRFRRQTNPYAINGVGDILCVYRGILISFEVKSEHGKQSAAQKIFEERLKKAGGYYFVVRSVKEVEDAMKAILAEFEGEI